MEYRTVMTFDQGAAQEANPLDLAAPEDVLAIRTLPVDMTHCPQNAALGGVRIRVRRGFQGPGLKGRQQQGDEQTQTRIHSVRIPNPCGITLVVLSMPSSCSCWKISWPTDLVRQFVRRIYTLHLATISQAAVAAGFAFLPSTSALEKSCEK